MRRPLISVCSALAAICIIAASTPELAAGPSPVGLDADAPLFITSVTPARDQETLPDLSDPGLNTVIRVRFSTVPLTRDLLDDTNLVNGLSRKCAFIDQAFAPVRATPTLRRNVLTIDPFSAQQPVLRNGRYTLALKPSIRSVAGRLLNEGRAGFTTRFQVGSWQLPFVLVRVTPRHGQSDIGLRRQIVASFDRPLDPVTAFQAVRVEDRSTVPPTPIDALVTLERRGYDVVVRPGSGGYPAGTQVTLVIAGRGTATGETAVLLETADGVEFKRDWGPRWTADALVPTLFHSVLGDFDDVTGEFTTTFRTRDASGDVR